MTAKITHQTAPGKPASAVSLKMIVRMVLVTVLMLLILFLAAGRADWWQAWVYACLTVVLSLVSRYIVYLKNPDLIAERARFTDSEGIKDWDKRLVVWIAIAGPLTFMIVAGLDRRFGWTAEVALPAQLCALLVFLFGFALTIWAMAENAFFSSVVRIQADRGQSVVMSGPYHWVRHPGYAGAIVAWVVSPILLSSLWSSIPAVSIILLYIVRTALEDRVLQAELPGYIEYAKRTRYRLLPGIW